MTTLLFGRREQSRHCPSQVTANQLFTLFDLNLKKRYSFLTSVFLVFILLLIGSDHIKAQATPPCECDAPIDIGCSGSVVYYDELLFEFEENQCYQILCTLVIDAGLVNWNEVSLLMGEGSMIEVLSSLAVRDSYIGACDEMWQGFKARDGSQFIISGSRIESAEFGIQFESCTEFNCTHNDFVNNYIGIASGSPFEPIEFHVIRQGNLYGCRFWTEGTVPGPYPDQHYYPSWPEEPSEVPYDQGFAAIYFAGLSGLNVGLLGAPYSLATEFFR